MSRNGVHSLSNDIDNRRSYFRIPIIIGVECRSDEPPLTARITNMSIGGMFVSCANPIPAENSIAFTFHFPNAEFEHPVVGEGRIVWSRPYIGMGIQFTRLGEDDQERIATFLESFSGK